ncbi:MAG: peptidoglycan-binding domain 1 protein [Methylocystaceae bacterium]|nr:MAG: peptidoglycan-binding domain 1 protein [Methylocystaceae bacterium]KAF0212654.1 MAG: peptidoglycan-binding domain 1 [Methylocystaceae bacterium]TXT48284.1 MAG: peptidoglycan-binding domain 1 protein [Methylocystaceae bacterium]
MRDASLYASRFQASPTDRAPPRDTRRNGRRSIFARIFGAKPIGVTLILGIAAVAAIGVPMNALLLQDGRHPAPLFSVQPSNAVLGAPTRPARPPAVESRTERDANVPARAAPKDLIASKIERLDVAKSPDSGKSAPAKADAPHAADKKRDAIGLLIVGDPPLKASADKANKADKTPSADKTASADKSAPVDKNVLYAQRALLKLGYVVRSDGVLSGATRHALEKFEGDAGLPVKGRITPKVLQQLAARSRLPLP